MNTVAFACVEAPWLFDVAEPGANKEARPKWPPAQLQGPLLELAKANNLSTGEAERGPDAFFGSLGFDVQGAHCLSHSRRESLALHLFWEVLGLEFPFNEPKVPEADDPGCGPSRFVKWKASERNVFGCGVRNHIAMDTNASFLPVPANVESLICAIEADLLREEEAVAGHSWEWDFARLCESMDAARERVADKPVDFFRPWFLPADLTQVPHVVACHTQEDVPVLYISHPAQHQLTRGGSERAGTGTYELPQTFARSSMCGGTEETKATELPTRRLFLDPLSVTVFTRSLLRRRQHLSTWQDDWLFPRTEETARMGPRRSSSFEQYEQHSRYLVQLLCSETPSAYRSFDCPPGLQTPLRSPETPLNNTRRSFRWFKIGVQESAASVIRRGERSSSPHSGLEDLAGGREWRHLVKAGLREIDLADIDSGRCRSSSAATLAQVLADFYSNPGNCQHWDSLLRGVRLESEGLTLDDVDDVEMAITGELSGLARTHGADYLIEKGLVEIEGAEEMLCMLEGIAKGIRERAESSRREPESAGDATQVSQASSGSAETASSEDYSGIEATTERLLAERAEAMGLNEGELASVAPDAEAIAVFQSAH
ncbi:unnamed protein product [Parajaminaea phylloscopi]